MTQGQRFSVEMSPAYSSASNGVVERGVQTVQGQFRVLRSAVEEKWGVKLETAHSIWPWLVEYASFLINRGKVGHDRKTPYVAKPNEASSLAWLSVKRFCGEDAQSVEI